MEYPFGSVPYGGPESLTDRIRRLACASVNHYPRTHTGSWCWGYGYVCGRCFMYADPWSDANMARNSATVGQTPDQRDIAAISQR